MAIPRSYTDFSPRTVADVLDGMHATIRLPHEWSRRGGARNADHMRCDPCSPAARTWCLSGALDRIIGQVACPLLRERLSEDTELLLLTTARRIFGTPGLDSLQRFNDDRTTTHVDVLDVIAEARATLPMRPDYVPAPDIERYMALAISRSVNA